jgi:hypothetical protein
MNAGGNGMAPPSQIKDTNAFVNSLKKGIY